MLIPGGEHAEKDIPAAIERVRALAKNIPIVYAWPYEVDDIAAFLYRHNERF